ncbi:hypothetical protein [Tenacibaculum maritimum]|uniref:hypothetical protein n=1 Tax=Tenacibaculum maritimum TaxID=107401 RepID=UPI0038774088
MKRNHKIIILVFLNLILISATKEPAPKDFLSVGKKIEFNQEEFELKWSSHPSPEYYKQEYLRKDDKLPQYKKMMMVEAVKATLSVAEVVHGKLFELENRKKEDPVVNYQKFENKQKGEIMIDFMLSDGQSTYEWNIYRYQNQKNESGNYVVLYAYSYREYASNKETVIQFFEEIKKMRMGLIGKMGNMKIPNVMTNE